MSPAASEGHEIVCPIDLFGRVEGEIADLSMAINRAPCAVEKAPLAAELRGLVAALLDCEAYDEGNMNCRLCRAFSELRDKTAAVVEKAAALVH